MAYRRADHERWQQMDFVLGIKIELSNQHPVTDICDFVQGDYPKDFVFDGWHPQCFCYATPILISEDEMAKVSEAFARGETYIPKGKPVTDTPKGFKKWVKDHKEQIQGAKNLPYWVRNNKAVVTKIWKKDIKKVSESNRLSNINADLKNGKGYKKGEFVNVSMVDARKKLAALGGKATHEEAYIRLKDGRTLYNKSDIMAITFSQEECKLLDGAKILHNHDYGTLSAEDVITSLRHKAKSISAITENLEYKVVFSQNSYDIAKGTNLSELYNLSAEELHMLMLQENSIVFDAYRRNMQEEQVKFFCKRIKATYSKHRL